jgi:hypothetical protein
VIILTICVFFAGNPDYICWKVHTWYCMRKHRHMRDPKLIGQDRGNVPRLQPHLPYYSKSRKTNPWLGLMYDVCMHSSFLLSQWNQAGSQFWLGPVLHRSVRMHPAMNTHISYCGWSSVSTQLSVDTSAPCVCLAWMMVHAVLDRFSRALATPRPLGLDGLPCSHGQESLFRYLFPTWCLHGLVS